MIKVITLYDEDNKDIQNEHDSEILKQINDNLNALNEKLENSTTEETTENTTEENTEDTTEEITEGIIYKDSSADTHAYLSTEVENATINDLYTVALSVRNVLLLFVLVFFGIKAFGALKNVIYRIMNK